MVTQSSKSQKKIVNVVELHCRDNFIKWTSPITSRTDKEVRKQEWTSYLEQLTEDPDFGVVCSYGYMLPSRLIRRFKSGIIVVHPSLLPKYRGGAPIFHAIANGDSVSGVSYIEVSEHKFDQGSILHQVQCNLDLKANYKEV